MKRPGWVNLVRNPPVPKRSVINCVAASLVTITAIFETLMRNLDPLVFLSLAGLSFVFWVATALVWRKERRNESKPLDEFLRDPLVSDKYVVHHFVVMSLILSITAVFLFYLESLFSLFATFPAMVYGYLAYVYWRRQLTDANRPG